MEQISVFDMLKIGVGPSSSHTLGPWRAAEAFVKELREKNYLLNTKKLSVDLYGSLSLTGKGHATDLAVMLGLSGADPEYVPIESLDVIITAITNNQELYLGNELIVKFNPKEDIVFNRNFLPFHANGLTFTASGDDFSYQSTFYSVGGGFIVKENAYEEEQTNKKNVPFPFPIDKAEELLQTLAPDIVIVIAYGKILPPWLIRLPQYGCINVHASILPSYRGAAPIHYAILNGDSKTGVTIMHMDDGLDTGDIIDIVEIDILPGETTGQLFERIAVLGGETIVPVLTRWVNGEIVATPQDDSMATHTTKITKEMGQIDWSKPANEIANLIRGLNPAPGCYTYLDGKRLKVWSGEVVPSDTTHCLIDVHGKHVPIAISATTVPGTIVSKIAGLGVFCGDGNIILLTEVQPENKKRISAIDFINGHQIKEGIVFGDSI